MKQSKKGNPWHDRLGRFCHGPFASTDSKGNPISNEQREEWETNSMTNERKNFYGIPTMPKNLGNGIGETGRFARKCAEAFGIDTKGIKFNANITSKDADGQTENKVLEETDGIFIAKRCSVRKVDKNRQIQNTYHEIFHLAKNGKYVGDQGQQNRARPVEEAMAEVSAIAMAQKNGIDGKGWAYSENIVKLLPRLKQTKDEYSDCETMADFGGIFIRKRQSENIDTASIENARYIEMEKEGLYYAQYRDDAEKYVDEAYGHYIDKKDKIFTIKAARMEFKHCMDELSIGKTLDSLSEPGKKIVCGCIRKAMEHGKIL